MSVLVALRVLILVPITTYSISAMSHIAQSWTMRKEFEMAKRSPGLAALSGCAGIFISLVTVIMYMLASEDDDSTGKIDGILLIPIMPTLYTGPYILRGSRLLVMYNPHMRTRWGALAREPVLTRAMVVSCVALEATSWTAVLFIGIQRVADANFYVYVADTLLTIGACVVLYGKLRRTDDLYKMSTEIQKVGAFSLLALGVGICYMFIRSRYAIVVWMMVRFHSSLWITNIQPVRTILRRRAGNNNSESGLLSSLFPYQPWKTHSSRKVAIGLGNSQDILFTTSVKSEDPGIALGAIMHAPPLLEAFKIFCKKALCSESIMFLLDAEEFNGSLGKAPTDTAAGYDQYVEIVDKYIREGSSFEVNIESKTRTEILSTTDRKTFANLTLEGKGQVLDTAVKEIAKILKDNLYAKFLITPECKHIQDQMCALEEVGG